jgi:hypothetical protein
MQSGNLLVLSALGVMRLVVRRLNHGLTRDHCGRRSGFIHPIIFHFGVALCGFSRACWRDRGSRRAFDSHASNHAVLVTELVLLDRESVDVGCTGD